MHWLPSGNDYPRTPGYRAANVLAAGDEAPRLANGGFVCLDGVQLRVQPFEDLLDPKTGRTRIRPVNLDSVHYRTARDYMIRLSQHDLEDDEACARLAAAARVSVEQFRSDFAPLREQEGAPKA